MTSRHIGDTNQTVSYKLIVHIVYANSPHKDRSSFVGLL